MAMATDITPSTLLARVCSSGTPGKSSSTTALLFASYGQPDGPPPLASMPQATTPRTSRLQRRIHAYSTLPRSVVLSDDDLAADLGSLSSKDGSGPTSSAHPPSQPSSLPIYAPVSRSPLLLDRISPYQRINLNIPTGTSFASRQRFGCPSDSGLSAGGSPPRSQLEQQSIDAQYLAGQRPWLSGIQYLPQGNNDPSPYNRSTSQGSLPSPLSPTTGRPIQPWQGPFYPQQMQRRSSDAPVPNLSDLGKGVPLTSVPASWPLYIVEFTPGRSGLFYLTDLSLDIRVGDLVIVEADRGEDLGTVVNDSITLKEVEAFEREQRERMIDGKAQLQDRQHFLAKAQDELKALQLCQNKVRQKKDLRKLTFYFIAEKRLGLRELVRELFRLYKTRIWMASLQGAGGYEQ
ncbi:hypothetical protein BKA83DRAFT_4466677 [Pisolithus microcarpus]|nr:hypothetical protein BKA83DRAFT_4466677 [Pisolithus microcarpus]